MANDAPKLQIDDDWKQEAAKEKERLAESPDMEGSYGLPPPSFAGLIQLLAMQAIVGLGGMAGPGGQDIPPNFELAKHHIDLLDVLVMKTSGNLDANEKAMLETTLHQLRMAYVEAVRGASQAGQV